MPRNVQSLPVSIERYFRRHPYRRIIAHLEGGALKVARQAAEACGITLEYSCSENPTSPAALNALDDALAGERKIKDDRLHGMISYQFNADVDTKGITLRGHYPGGLLQQGKHATLLYRYRHRTAPSYIRWLEDDTGRIPGLD